MDDAASQALESRPAIEGERDSRVALSPAAVRLLRTLWDIHGPLMFHQSGGCCDGSSPMCYPAGEFKTGNADILLENYSAGVMDRLGLGYETLHEVNPKLVYGTLRGFGDPRSGRSPYTDWPAFDVVAQASDASALLRAVTFERPDAAIIDVRMPPTHSDEGVVAAQRILADLEKNQK